MKNLSFDFSAPSTTPLVLDVETQFLSEEVPGGWNAVHKFKVAVVVTWDQVHGHRAWYEEEVSTLFTELEKHAPLVTFNGEGFDFKVLSAYGDVAPLYAKSVDLLAILGRKLGFRVKLESLAQATLGRGKSGSGAESVEWWRSGDPALRQKVVDYCKLDVELTRDLYFFGREKGYVLIDDLRRGLRRRIDVAW